MYEVSIVIPCYNGASVIIPQLTALAAQADARTEIIVADNRSSDDIETVVREFARRVDADIRVVSANDRQGINHARNCGVRASSGQFVLLCDADDVVSDGWVARMVSVLRLGAECVGGAMHRCTPDGKTIEYTRGVTTRFWKRAGVYVGYATGANCGFTRSLFDRLGGFDEDFAGGSDENDFFVRASLSGRRPVLVAEAVVDYTQRARLRDAMRQNVAYGVGGVRLHRKFAHEGMPRDSWWVPPVTVVVSTISCFIGSSSHRRIGAERLARRWGRLRGSLRLRHLYL